MTIRQLINKLETIAMEHNDRLVIVVGGNRKSSQLNSDGAVMDFIAPQLPCILVNYDFEKGVAKYPDSVDTANAVYLG